MLVEFKTDNPRDFKQRYQGSYGVFLADSGKKLVRVDAVSDSKVDFIDEQGEKYFVRPDSGYFFEFLPGTRKIFESLDGSDLLAVQRVPARQWHRGIHEQNTVFRSVITGESYRPTFEYLKAMQGLPGKNFLERMAAYKGGHRRHFMINEMFSFVARDVFIFDKKIGKVNAADGTVSLSSDLFRSELKDALFHKDSTFKVL